MAGKGIIESTLILTIANVINRILGFGYRIYMSNVLGSEGMGLYQLIMPLYSLAWSISCSGFTTTVSKLVAGEKAKGQHGNMGRILKQALAITSGLGILLNIILFLFADTVALNMFHDNRLALALKILSMSFPFMAAGTGITVLVNGI
ncbi:oligosaccharide flippase family protein [Tyzzerella sp. OttesenSCG-928-J15]|nr:oligosaccharide flippase family protein [Tyzzerella sp. OttesenSCG-928-J15]